MPALELGTPPLTRLSVVTLDNVEHDYLYTQYAAAYCNGEYLKSKIVFSFSSYWNMLCVINGSWRPGNLIWSMG